MQTIKVQVERAPAIGVKDPIEGNSQKEEGRKMQDLVIYHGIELK